MTENPVANALCPIDLRYLRPTPVFHLIDVLVIQGVQMSWQLIHQLCTKPLIFLFDLRSHVGYYGNGFCNVVISIGFNRTDVFKGYGVQVREGHNPLYQTTSQQYGWFTPNAHTVPQR